MAALAEAKPTVRRAAWAFLAVIIGGGVALSPRPDGGVVACAGNAFGITGREAMRLCVGPRSNAGPAEKTKI